MNFDPITNAVAIAIQSAQRRYQHIQLSQTVVATGNGTLILRAMGAAGGGGGVGSNGIACGGNGGTVCTRTLSVQAGDVIACTIPAGGVGGTWGPGTTGGTLVVHRNGIAVLTVPGGNGGTGGAPANNALPTGADLYFLGGLGGYGAGAGGGGTLLLIGGTSAARGGNGTGSGGGGAFTSGGDAAGSYGGGVNGFMTADGCYLKLAQPISGNESVPAYAGGVGTPAGNGGNGGFGGGGGGGGSSNAQGGNGGFGGGGGGGSSSSSAQGGNGGFGGGGGGSSSNGSAQGGNGGFGGGGGGASGFSASTGGYGGQGFLTLEWIGGCAA